jgi:hypothetical protein
MVHVYFDIHVKCTKSTCFCSENTVKTYENTSKPVHFRYNIWYMCILVYVWNVPKVHVSAVKTQWKHMKTHENTSKTVHFMYYIWYMCILVYMWNVPKVHVSAVKSHWKHIKTLAKMCISYIIYGTYVFWYTCEMFQKYMFLQWKHSETHKNTWKHMKTLAKLCISCIIYGTCVFWYTCEMYQKYMFLQWKHSENIWKH